MIKKLENKIALVTGASRGIGAAIAKEYAKEGAHVILAARTVSGLEEVDDAIKEVGGSSTLVPIDLLEFDKIDQLGGLIYERFGKLDILVGNAGMLGQLTPVAHIDPKVWDKTMALNLTANYRLIRSFHPLLRQASQGRAIFVSTILEAVNPYWGVYSTSKAALENLVKTYAMENKQNNIRANIVEPSAVNTNMMKEVAPGGNPSDWKTVEQVAKIFVDLAEDSFVKSGKIFRV
jgi:NAD(P)-dependent dehydrogenase (short-subunit alcohol dehydrogenase family)